MNYVGKNIDRDRAFGEGVEGFCNRIHTSTQIKPALHRWVEKYLQPGGSVTITIEDGAETNAEVRQIRIERTNGENDERHSR